MGEEEGSKISAGENILVIKTPKGLYVRTKSGRIYAVNSGNKFNSSSSRAWQSEQFSMPYTHQSSPSVYAADSPRPMLDPWGSSNSGVDMYNNMPYNNMPGISSMLNGEPYSARYQSRFSSAQRELPGSIPSFDAFSDVSNIDPMSFLNITTSDNGNFAWNSSVACHSMGSVIPDEVGSNMNPPLSWMPQHLRQDRSEYGVKHRMLQSSCSCTDLPSDLMCIDASSVTDCNATSDSTLPALTVRDMQNDSDSMNSLTFDDYDNLHYNRSSGMDRVLSDRQSPVYSTHSNVTVTPASLFSSTATTTGALDVGDVSDRSADWSELSAVMNDVD